MRLSKFLECNRGKLFVISGPSGTGKGTICRKVVEKINAEISISMTTREPRTGEEDGIEYYFVNNDEFDNKIEQNGFLEYAEVFGKKYGTPKQMVLDKLEEGKDVILEIDVQGALQVKESYDEAVLVFVLPPSMNELKRRIVSRGTETDNDIDNRLSNALDEIGIIDQYEYTVINDKLDIAVGNIISIIQAEHFKVKDYKEKILKKLGEEQ
ncbi:MAG TPA: guanylate kinase [Anaerovoracaceae bacterium]|nr:guanylate kinase [Anaerovoracaceae bacterium]